MSASNICCTHQQLRIDSPEPPPRPLATIDGMFAAAVLPEDHPHALKFPERKPETDSAIVQSPSITSKIKLQFSRKSVKNLKKGKEYDDDARQVTLQEVLHDLEDDPGSPDEEGQIHQDLKFGSVVELPKSELAVPKAVSPEVRTSVLKSLGYLRPLLQKSSEQRLSGRPDDFIELATLVATRPRPIDGSNGNDISAIPKSLSSPTLPLDDTELCNLPSRSRSEFDLCNTLTSTMQTASHSDRSLSENECPETLPAISPPQSTADVTPATLHVRESTKSSNAEDLAPVPEYKRTQTPSQDDNFHLHKMDISQQLRSMSQMSEAVEDEANLYPFQSWTFHHRERSDIGVSSREGRHSRQKSSSGVESSTVPLSWGRVRSPVRDTASSMYSRPVSAAAHANERNVSRRGTPLYEPLDDLNALFADWPLKQSTPTKEPRTVLKAIADKRSGIEKCNKPLPSIPTDGHKDSGSISFGTTSKDDENASVRFLSPPPRAESIPSKSSSSTLTKASKQSKFLEGFSPPRKAVRKRLSVFKFLRPGSKRQQERSISSPILTAKCPSSTAAYDGQSDEPTFLTIQYELADRPSQIGRSASMSQLGTPSQETGGHIAPQPMLERRPTLADYERNLSVIGDDRRRPSAVNIQRVKEIQEDDRRESVGLRRRLSRARALRDDASPLMAQALEKHQQEKALFRSASKQRDSIKETHPSPALQFTPSSHTASSLPPPSLSDYNDLVDPLEKGQLVSPTRRWPDGDQLLSPPTQPPASSQRTSPAASGRIPSTKTSIVGPSSHGPPQAGKRIGTSLESWSRYPSHTRGERCGSAGPKDAILTHDFAVEINPEAIQGSEETDTPSLNKRNIWKSGVRRSKSSTPSIRSVTFSGIMRYYSNLFHTSGWHGQNRRTSVTIGGRLEYPELEMLPPQTPTETTGSHKHFDYLKRFEEHVKEDTDKLKHYLQDEETKVEGYMKKEEDKFEGFMKMEEHKVEDFLKKEEGKLKDFMVEEEDKLMHSRHRRGSSAQSSQSKGSRFRAGSIFEAPRNSRGDELKRNETMIAPNDSIDEGAELQKTVDSRLALDGSGCIKGENNDHIPSKAEIWSELYKECLIRPVSRAMKEADSTNAVPASSDKQTQIMPPPALRPVKPRTPDKPSTLDPKATIRRFPSVTVIDDRKGHYRSISLVSVKTSKSANFERSSTHDFVDLIQAREQEERDKLLNSIRVSNSVEGPNAV